MPSPTAFRRVSPLPLLSFVALLGCTASADDSGADPGAETEAPVSSILSAYHGLDDSLVTATCSATADGTYGGIPVVFDEELQSDSIEAGDFELVLAGGQVVTPTCITLAPADDTDENRTLLLIGQFGEGREADSTTGYPVTLTVVGEVLAEGADDNRNLQGDTFTLPDTQYYSDGLFLSYAESFTSAEDDPSQPCPADAAQRVRVIFSGGATEPIENPIPNADPAYFFIDDFGCDVSAAQSQVPGYDNDGAACVCAETGSDDCGKFTVVGSDGEEYHPYAIGDTFDGDNNLELCMSAPEGTTFTTVRVAAGTAYDPAPSTDVDYLDDLTVNVNAETELAITQP